MAYPTAAEIVAITDSAALLALPPDEQAALWARSVMAVEAYTGQSFAGAVDKAIEVESVQGDALYLPERLVALESITGTSGDPLDQTAVVITHNGGRLKWKHHVVGVGYYRQALQEISGYSYPTAFPTGWVLIDGTWGWVDCPPVVALALQWDMEESAASDSNALSATVSYMRSAGIDRIAQGNLDLSLAPMPSVSPRVQQALDGYVFLGTPAGRLV